MPPLVALPAQGLLSIGARPSHCVIPDPYSFQEMTRACVLLTCAILMAAPITAVRIGVNSKTSCAEDMTPRTNRQLWKSRTGKSDLNLHPHNAYVEGFLFPASERVEVDFWSSTSPIPVPSGRCCYCYCCLSTLYKRLRRECISG